MNTPDRTIRFHAKVNGKIRMARPQISVITQAQGCEGQRRYLTLEDREQCEKKENE